MPNLIEKYAYFVCHHPFIILVIVGMLTLSSIYFASTITMKTTSRRDFLPESEPSIRTLFSIEDEFGSTNTVYFVVETNPKYSGSDEVKDVRDPRVLRYMNAISELARHTDDVIEVRSMVDILKSINNGRIPSSIREVKRLTYKNGIFNGYVSKDYSIALVKITTTGDVNYDSLETELNKIIRNVKTPSGVSTSLGGTILEQQVMKKNIPNDMRKTSFISIIGILFVVLMIFRSAKYGLTPLITVVLGSLWAMGFVGLIGMGLSSATSGVLSMIMGIGIDFGIQVVTRYRMELYNTNPIDAMTTSLSKVITPMSTTTLSALIGFQALHLGKLTFLGDMGTIMSYGVAACMVAAITAVPALIIIFDTIKFKR